MCPRKGFGLRPGDGQAWLIEVRGLANRSEGFGTGLAQALSIKVKALGGQAGPGPVDKSEGFGGPGRPRPCR